MVRLKSKEMVHHLGIHVDGENAAHGKVNHVSHEQSVLDAELNAQAPVMLQNMTQVLLCVQGCFTPPCVYILPISSQGVLWVRGALEL